MMKLDVLDKGYVRYDKHMGDDLDPVNSAKVSFDRASATFEEREARLLGFLVREEHKSVFRHSAMTLEVYAPLIIARQWWKYAVASSHVEDQLGWNESSRRYITEEPEFYVVGPNQWRSSPENKKQGSGPVLDSKIGGRLTGELVANYIACHNAYEKAMSLGVAPEQARLFLSAYGLYVRWRWTFSLGAGLHFLHQRLAHDAQSEIRDYAEAVREQIADKFPFSVEATLETF